MPNSEKSNRVFLQVLGALGVAITMFAVGYGMKPNPDPPPLPKPIYQSLLEQVINSEFAKDYAWDGYRQDRALLSTAMITFTLERKNKALTKMRENDFYLLARQATEIFRSRAKVKLPSNNEYYSQHTEDIPRHFVSLIDDLQNLKSDDPNADKNMTNYIQNV